MPRCSDRALGSTHNLTEANIHELARKTEGYRAQTSVSLCDSSCSL